MRSQTCRALVGFLRCHRDPRWNRWRGGFSPARTGSGNARRDPALTSSPRGAPLDLATIAGTRSLGHIPGSCPLPCPGLYTRGVFVDLSANSTSRIGWACAHLVVLGDLVAKHPATGSSVQHSARGPTQHPTRGPAQRRGVHVGVGDLRAGVVRAPTRQDPARHAPRRPPGLHRLELKSSRLPITRAHSSAFPICRTLFASRRAALWGLIHDAEPDLPRARWFSPLGGTAGGVTSRPRARGGNGERKSKTGLRGHRRPRSPALPPCDHSKH